MTPKPGAGTGWQVIRGCLQGAILPPVIWIYRPNSRWRAIFTSQEYEDIAIAGPYGPGAGFWVVGCKFGGVHGEPVGWERRNKMKEGFEYYCSGGVSARFAVAGDFDGDGPG